MVLCVCLFARPETIARNIMPTAGASAGWSAVGGCLRRTSHSAWRSSCGRTGCGWATLPAHRWSCWPCCGCSQYSGTAAAVAVRTAAKRRVCCPSTMTALKSECYIRLLFAHCCWPKHVCAFSIYVCIVYFKICCIETRNANVVLQCLATFATAQSFHACQSY